MRTTLSIFLISTLFSGGLTTARTQPIRKARTEVKVASTPSLAQILDKKGEYSMFAAALEASGLDKQLRGGTYTILAPTNAAFSDIPASTMDMLMFRRNKDILRRMVSYHIIPGIVGAEQLRSPGAMSDFVQSRSLAAERGRWEIPGATIVNPNIRFKQGVVHTIDRVLIPEEPILEN